MISQVELFVGSRYIFARRGNHFIAFISMTAIIATTLGVAVLLTILSIMNGFEGELRQRILGMAAHLEIEQAGLSAADWHRQLELVQGHDAVAAAAPYLSRDVLVQHHGQVRAVEARGVDFAAEQRVTTLADHLSDVGSAKLTGELLSPGRFEIVIGQELASQFNLHVGESLMLLSPRPIVTPAGLVPRMKRFKVVGIFEFGLQEHDSGLVLINREDGARLFRLGEGIDGIRVRLHQPDIAPDLKVEFKRSLGHDVKDWSDTHRNLFRALKTEKLVMFLILALAIGIAAFNLVAILVVAVTEKRGDIAMLLAMGMSAPAIMRIFLVQGGITGILGVVGGLALGLLLASNVDPIVTTIEQVLGFKVLSPDIFYISSVPSDPRWPDFVLTAVFAGLLALLAPIYPAWLAAQTDPSEGLRHE